ncbi:DUF2993 domain-containing protein [Rathayibacter sp. KR2-224]|uniref:LmeA family phospholipid-binding protein n=1 Tax=Rathayibacter sp. KR2-224 TaxID=3400913 RepID=UPI003C0145CA
MQDQPTQPLTESTAGAHDGAHPGRSGSDQRNVQVRFNGAQRLVLWSASALIVLIGVFFVTDAVLRQVAQNVVREQIQNELPADVTAKDLSVKIDGFSVIAQFMAGRFDKVELSSSNVRIQGNPLTARVVAHGIPLDFNKPVQRVEGTMRISQDAVNNLVDLPNHTTVTLNPDEVGLKGTGQILGIDVGYTASVTPSLQNGDTVVLTPISVNVTAGGGAFDVTRFAKDLVPSRIPICIAQYLPARVDATGLSVDKRAATVSVVGDDLVLGGNALQKRGSCS